MGIAVGSLREEGFDVGMRVYLRRRPERDTA